MRDKILRVSPTPIPAERCHLGGDFYLTTLPTGASDELRVDVGFPHPEWRARRAAAHGRAAFAGSAILVGERWYEIFRIGTHPSPGRRPETSYYLRPWDESFILRKVYELTPEVCRDVTVEHRRQQQREATRKVLRRIPFLLGLLPAEDQLRIESRYGLPAGPNTVLSATLLLLLSVLTLAVAFAFWVGHRFGALDGLIERYAGFPWIYGYVYMTVESYVRMRAAATGNPVGSLPVALPILALRAVARALSPAERLSAAAGRAHRTGDRRFATARDEVRRLADGDADLEVVSLLPKDHWLANVTGIGYGGETYVLVEREALQTSDGVRHRFLLQKPEHEVLFKTFCEYRPEEVRDVYRARRRLDASTWVETFRLLWGLLDGDRQLRLGRIYDYDPWKLTLRTTIGVGALAALAVADTVWNAAHGTTTPVDGLKLLGGIVLLWESALRWRSYRAAEIRGSLLGVPLKPLADRFLRWE